MSATKPRVSVRALRLEQNIELDLLDNPEYVEVLLTLLGFTKCFYSISTMVVYESSQNSKSSCLEVRIKETTLSIQTIILFMPRFEFNSV